MQSSCCSAAFDRGDGRRITNMRAILWVETPGMDKVLRFIPENAEFLPHDVNSIKSWFEAGWKVYASGGITALELRGGGHQKGVTRLVSPDGSSCAHMPGWIRIVV